MWRNLSCGVLSNAFIDLLGQRFFSPTTTNMKEPYPEIQGGGSLILAWQVRNKKVLVIGGGEVRSPLQKHAGSDIDD